MSGLVVAGRNGELMGILTARDVRAEPDARLVRDVMTPRERLVTASQDVTLEDAFRLMHEHRIEKLPLFADGRLAGLITMHDIELRERLPDATRDGGGRLRVAAAVGVRGDALARAEALVRAAADALVLDIAHGHADHALQTLGELKASWPHIEVVSGTSRRATASVTSPKRAPMRSRWDRTPLRLHDAARRRFRRPAADRSARLRARRA